MRSFSKLLSMINHVYKKIAVMIGFSLFSVGGVAGELASEQAHGSEEVHGKNELGLFAGITREGDESLNTLGIEYSYRISEAWSLGGVIEQADRERDSTLVIAFAHWWPYKGLIVGAGVGRKDPGDSRENTFRASIGYEFEFGEGWTIVPQANLDIIEGHENEEVYGIAIGRRF